MTFGELSSREGVVRVSRLLGVRRQQVWQWSSGRQRPSAETLARVGEALDLSEEELDGLHVSEGRVPLEIEGRLKDTPSWYRLIRRLSAHEVEALLERVGGRSPVKRSPVRYAQTTKGSDR